MEGVGGRGRDPGHLVIGWGCGPERAEVCRRGAGHSCHGAAAALQAFRGSKLGEHGQRIREVGWCSRGVAGGTHLQEEKRGVGEVAGHGPGASSPQATSTGLKHTFSPEPVKGEEEQTQECCPGLETTPSEGHGMSMVNSNSKLGCHPS